ncbi:DUF2975 domain-containing protein [Gulosibacter faecalis]|jgi:hypothetical protein|uniref:DUF2975 domain-containing protein n=1 Tax=Gulosibacter faecalis TaxID=272240 RepID=A0ABW5UXR3_9MICO|nr:DUF2975 domain-containing protein [Gulosibacter faecalis]
MQLNVPRPPLALVIATEALLGVLFLIGLSAIVLLPEFSANVATNLPEYADLRDPLLSLAIALTALGLIAIVCISLVLRSLLRNAIAMRAELDEVV